MDPAPHPPVIDLDQQLNNRMHQFLVPNASSHQPLFNLPSVRTRNVLPGAGINSREQYRQWAPRSEPGQRPPIDVLAENMLHNRGIPLQSGANQVPASTALRTEMPEFTANTSSTNVGDEAFPYLFGSRKRLH